MSDEVVSWVDADGGITVLPVEWDAHGRFMPQVIIDSDEVPGREGAVPRQARHGVHEFILPLWLTDSTPEALRTQLRTLVDVMNPVNDDDTVRLGKIQVQSVLGDVREIECAYASGLEMAEKINDSSGPTFQRVPISFTAFDPYWQDPSPSSKTFTVTSVPKFFPIFPLHLTASQLVVDDVVVNAGSVKTWPVWTITGPGTDIVLTNLTTGQKLDFGSHALGTGEVLTVDTRPGHKSATLQDGTSVYSWVDWTVSIMWPIGRGTSVVSLDMAGITVGVSSLQVSYQQRYLSP